jgi:hypothetical protein
MKGMKSHDIRRGWVGKEKEVEWNVTRESLNNALHHLT